MTNKMKTNTDYATLYPYSGKRVTVKLDNGETFTFLNQTRELSWPYTEDQVVKVEDGNYNIKCD